MCGAYTGSRGLVLDRLNSPQCHDNPFTQIVMRRRGFVLEIGYRISGRHGVLDCLTENPLHCCSCLWHGSTSEAGDMGA